jgi:hypothetical protein
MAHTGQGEVHGPAPAEDPRVTEARSKEAAAKSWDEEAEAASKTASRLRSQARDLRYAVRQDDLLADPLICRDHGQPVLFDDRGAMATGYPYHYTVDEQGRPRHASNCSGPTVGRQSSFAEGELEAYRARVTR